MRLLKQAGYEVRDQQLVNVKTGEPYTFRPAPTRRAG
jgi:hypothetical protein